MFCTKCGKEIPDNTTYCPHCGTAQAAANQQQTVQQPQQTTVDNGGFGWAALGFCIPIVGLILFLVWNKEKPKTAKSAGMGALVSVIIGVVMYIITFAIGFSTMY